MNDSTIKEALAYSLGADLHEVWRNNRRLDDGTYEPRMKKSKDEAWNIEHGTDDVDIANLSFSNLPSNWQYENLEAARTAIDLVYDGVMSGIQFSDIEIEEMSSSVHIAWLQRNLWVFDSVNGNKDLAVVYADLSDEEKAKDRVQVFAGIDKVQAYKNGEINIDELIDLYGIHRGKSL